MKKKNKMNRLYVQFVRRKGKGGPWTAGFIHLEEGIVGFGDRTDRLSSYELMPGRFFSLDSFLKKFGELKRKGMIQRIRRPAFLR
jgi:hypothetical protein